MTDCNCGCNKNKFPPHFTETVKQCGVKFNSEHAKSCCYKNLTDKKEKKTEK